MKWLELVFVGLIAAPLMIRAEVAFKALGL
jgi:hypothetical protein